MRHLFPILATFAALLLASALVAGWAAPGGTPDRLGWAAALLTTGVHALAYGSVLRSSRRIRETAGSSEMPDWVEAQAEKNQRKVAVYLMIGLPLAMRVALVSEAKVRGATWLIALAGLNLAFQIGSFVGEFVVLDAQARLNRDVGDWAGPAPQA